MSSPPSKRRGKGDDHASPQRPKTYKKNAEVVEIDGVPPNVSPKLVDAIRAAQTFFKHHPVDPIYPRFETQTARARITRNSINDNNDLVASIMHRVEQAKDRENREKEDARRDAMIQSLHAWLRILDRGENDASSSSAAFACFNYLWNVQNHDRPSVRRMSLYLSGHLLLRNKECRDRWQDILLDWISAVVNVNLPLIHAKEALLWQKESMAWVAHIAEQFPENNRFQVAKMYLEHKGPSMLAEGIQIGKKTADWRRIRDMALAHGKKQCDHVEKLVRRAYSCIDTLMPRVGLDLSGAKHVYNQEKGDDDDDDDDDEVDWEEGDEEEARETHAEAVEQTLALMQTTGGLRGGDMEIRLGKVDSESAGNDESEERLTKRLQKLITSLSSKHLPCLSSWVNSLNQSDNLMLANGSLVSMPPERVRERRILLERLTHVKRSVASVLAAASRLKVNAAQEIDNSANAASFLTNIPRRHLGLSRTMESRIRGRSSNVTSKRSNRVKIKFNK